MLVVLLGLAGVGIADDTGPENLLVNGDFEIGAAGAASRGKLPMGWTKYIGDNAILELVPETRPESKGKQCLKIGANAESKNGGIYSQLTPLDPGKPLKFSGYVRDGAVDIKQTPHISIAWYDAEQKPIDIGLGNNFTYIGGCSKIPEWQSFGDTFAPVEGAKPFNASFNFPAGTAFFQIRLCVLSYTGPVWFDDVVVTQDVDIPKK